MNGGACFGFDGEGQLRRLGAHSSGAKREWHGRALAIGAQVVDFPAVTAPAQALRFAVDTSATTGIGSKVE